jgi:hypothetical protein
MANRCVLFMLGISAATEAASLGGSIVERVDLAPTKMFSLSKVAPWQRLLVREMRCASDGVWFLVDSGEQKGVSAIIGTDNIGTLRCMVNFPQGRGVGGLAVTSRGIATTTFAQRQALLTEYDPGGHLLSSTPIPCYAAEQLFTMGGNPTTVCPDGTITSYAGSIQLARWASWARPGSRWTVEVDSLT